MKPIVAIHRNDPQWIIALWLAIHGGDPAPEISAEKARAASAEIIRAVTAYLDPAKAKAVGAAMGH